MGAPSSPTTTSHDPGTRADIDGLSLLMLEDDPVYAQWLETTLRAQAARRSEPIRLQRHRDLTTWLAQHKRRFDVILVDLELPDSSGWATVERVRERAKDTPIVVLSSRDDLSGAKSHQVTTALTKGRERPQHLLRILQQEASYS